MSQKTELEIKSAALVHVVDVARTYASAGAALTMAAMDALLIGCHVEDVVEAVKGGFEEAGQTMPQALASNIRRVHAAGPEWIQRIKETGLALNNKLLDALEVPKASASKGRPKAEEKAEPKTPADLRGDTLEGAKHMLRALLAGKAKVCSTAILDKYENCLTECLALLSAK